jgi:Flp pilus assembly protein TadD
MLAVWCCVIASTLGAACLTRAQRPISTPLVQRGASAPPVEIMPPPDPSQPRTARVIDDATKASAGLLREATRTAAARPPISGSADDLNQNNPALAAARLRVSLAPTPENHRALADLYMQLGIHDAAYDQYEAVLRRRPRDAGASDGLARIWRDWGYPATALPHAHRAVYFAPRSAAAQNTLGTVFLRLGRSASAERAFTRALQLSPSAPYALNNLCYAAVVRGEPDLAIARCERALQLTPRSPTVLNNLALAYAAKGDFETAALRFSEATSQPDARYNLGIALMATRHYADAALAFDDASALGHGVAQAKARAVQARALAAARARSGVPDAGSH